MQSANAIQQPVARRSTTSSLLAELLPGVNVQHKMDTPHILRPKAPFSYAESEPPTPHSTVETPRNQRFELDVARAKGDGKDQDEDEDDSIQYTTPSRSRRNLRPSRANQSLKATENGEVQRRRPRTSRKKTNAISDLVGGDINLTPVSKRVMIRQEIANKTAANRNRFFIEKKDFWLPLLPPHNYIQKLVDKHASDSENSDLPAITPYEEIEKQPRGVLAVMKPYQLSGLSFMMYLHKNGLSGILGDEMGLGKTLQTLSLIQHLKETDPKAGTGRLQRPFLIVCPLSVLSSWMQEAKKWTPGLKAIRFHGPAKERDRLKRIVVGEMDMFGNVTAQGKSKLKSRKNAAGKEVIFLDTDSDNEQDVGVDLVVTTYECYRVEQGWFKKAFVWRYVVLDEGHTVKNHDSLVSKSLQGLQAEYRLILTGTPLQNDLSELWSLLHWLYPEVFIDKTNELFDNSFNLSKGQFSSSVLDSARHLLELIMLRRMKNSAGVDLNLPPKTEVLMFVPLSPMQRFWYTRLITKADQGLLDELFKGAKSKEEEANRYLQEEEERELARMKLKTEGLALIEDNSTVGTEAWQESKDILRQTIQREQDEGQGNAKTQSAWQKLMNLVMQLRKVCNHPYQIANAEPDPYQTGDHVIMASGKFIVLEKLIQELVIKQRKKILIFSGFTKMLDLVEEFLLLRGGDGTSFRSARIDGGTSRARRNLAIRLVNDLNSDYRVMLISTRAGGLGINLASASDVILLDQDWNPQITLQAEARAHRIGQKNPVTVYKLVSQGTVEEQMMGRIQKKLYLSAKVTEAMEDIHTKFGSGKKAKKGRPGATEDMPQLSTNQLMSLVRRGASAISRPEIDVDEMLGWDWETTLAKCKDQPADVNVKKDAIPDSKVDEEAEKKWLTEMEHVEASIFRGQKLASAKFKSNKDISHAYLEDLNREDRRLGKNTTVMIDGYAISKESVGCAQWEAVPTISTGDTRFADVKRAKRAAIEPQGHCQVCMDGGELHCCQLCPRAFHFKCLDRAFQSKAKGWQFNCPQHQCYDCEQKTTDAGGMLYRCRWCERAFCEDCMDWDQTKLIGNNLPEYELLRYPEMGQAFYVQCAACTRHFAENPKDQKLCEGLAEEWQADHYKMFAAGNSRAGSLTDATTIETPGVHTPIVLDDDNDNDDDDDDDKFQKTMSRKRKVKGETSKSVKRGKVRS